MKAEEERLAAEAAAAAAKAEEQRLAAEAAARAEAEAAQQKATVAATGAAAATARHNRKATMVDNSAQSSPRGLEPGAGAKAGVNSIVAVTSPAASGGPGRSYSRVEEAQVRRGFRQVSSSHPL